MNRPIRKVAAALGVLLAAVFLNLNYVQVVKGHSYGDTEKYADNKLPLLNEYSSPRGQIVVQGSAIAHSVKTKDELKYLRKYPHGPVYAPVTGYYSFVYGSSAMENAESDVLSGDDPRLFGTQLADLLTGRDKRGGSVVLTLNKAAQEAAYKAMLGSDGRMRRGAIVALDPATGAILAAVSTPSYDPSVLSSHNAEAINKAYKTLIDDPTQPMLNRAFNQLYPPGSVFKVIDSAAALKHGIKKDDRVPAPNSYWPLGGSGPCPAGGGACIKNFGGEVCDDGRTATLAFALAKSCNTTFAQLAVTRIGGADIAEQARLFGLDSGPMEVPLGVNESTVGTEQDVTDPAALAQTSIGQRDVRITPLQAAMIASAVANEGMLMKPHLVAQERGPNLSVLDNIEPTQLEQVLDPALNQELQQMMIGVVTNPAGTGRPANITDIPGVVVGGKTGTAETGGDAPPHAWFAGFALQNGNPKIAVAVIIENGGVTGSETTGGEASAPVAKDVMEAYLKSIGGR